MLLLIYTCGFGSLALLGLAGYPPLLERGKAYLAKRAAEAGVQLEDIFLTIPQRKLASLHVLAPLGTALLGWLISQNLFMALGGAAVGVVVPKIFIQQMKAQRRKKFHAQLVDSLLLISSCLRAGLSMPQSFTVVAEEMQAPISQEFGLVLKETRMGVNLDEALVHFKQRMPSDDTTLFVTGVLIARESGGDITSIFGRLVETMRDRRKVKEKIKTLTFMARLQGIVMGLLPVVFMFVTYSIDRNHFDFFLKDPTGKLMLAGVIVTQLFGAYLFMRFSRSPI